MKHLLHVGYPKSGSCFLGEWFHHHPAFFFKDFKLSGIESTSDFCKIALQENNKNKYCVIRDMIFSCPIVNEITYLSGINEYQEKICATLYDLFPDSKVLIVTRGFESAIISGYCQYIKEGGTASLRDLIINAKDSNWLTYNYSFLINLYNNYFGKENVIVVPFELLKECPKDFLTYIESKLDIVKEDIEIGKINVALPPHYIFALRKINIIIYNFCNGVGRPGRILYKFYIKHLNSKKTDSKKRFLISKCFSVFFKKKSEDLNIPKELLFKHKYFGEIIKEYKIFEKYRDKYLIND
jgi:hypothetical protein